MMNSLGDLFKVVSNERCLTLETRQKQSNQSLPLFEKRVVMIGGTSQMRQVTL